MINRSQVQGDKSTNSAPSSSLLARRREENLFYACSDDLTDAERASEDAGEETAQYKSLAADRGETLVLSLPGADAGAGCRLYDLSAVRIAGIYLL